MCAAPNSAPNLADGDPSLTQQDLRSNGPIAFVDESISQPHGPEAAKYTLTAVLYDRGSLIDGRLAMLKVTGGATWHTTDAYRNTPGLITLMVAAVAAHTSRRPSETTNAAAGLDLAQVQNTTGYLFARHSTI